jgi:hypothetical protein
MAEKKRVLVDGIEVAGLVRVGELVLEKGTIEVPEFKKIRLIQNGITKIPVIELTYKVQRDSETLKKLRQWYNEDEVHDVIIIRTDAGGTEFARTLLQACESVLYQEPEFDGANPTYAQVKQKWVPYEVIPLDAM